VHVLPLPRDAAALVEGLIGNPTEPGDVVVVFGTEAAASEAVRKYQSNSTVLLQAVLTEGWDDDEGTGSFVARYQRAYGTAPGVLAATGYHAARRLDVAIRPLDGVFPRAALEDAWRSTDSRMPW
jgi:ABC-type branched-subunit amino acid transport system substrate-binding protein